MNIYYHPKYNISLGFLNRLHPFDGKKFEKVYKAIKDLNGIQIKQPEAAVSHEVIDEFADESLRLSLYKKEYIMRALEVPRIPLLPFSVIKKRILLPMRWGVAGTLAAARDALNGANARNLGGGFHHASQHESEGFCIYNDIGIAMQELKKEGLIEEDDRFLILDIDAHQGNGNARLFVEENRVHDYTKVDLFDIYNDDIYPQQQFLKERVDINLPLRAGTGGAEYFRRLEEGFKQLKSGYRMAFVIAGTDVVASDPLGHLKLTVEECVTRDMMVMEKLQSLSIPTVFLGGGGYSADSAASIIGSVKQMNERDW